MKKVIRIVLAVLLCIVLACAAAFAVFYASRLRTLASVEQLSAYEDGYNLYRMNVCYDYSIERMIARGIDDDQAMIDTVLKEALPLLPVKLKAPAFGCTAFTVRDTESGVHMGRNYDFKNDTSAMLVYCAPKNGYRSVAFAALDNVSANTPEQSRKQKIAALTAPFICLDGMNEKGVSIAVLTLDSAPTHQKNGKPTIFTTLAIRLVLDRAASTAEAVALLGEYDMLATSGRDYHFYITDAAGDGRVIEYDCESEARTLVATPSEAVTNFFILYKDRVLPNQKTAFTVTEKRGMTRCLMCLPNSQGLRLRRFGQRSERPRRNRTQRILQATRNGPSTFSIQTGYWKLPCAVIGRIGLYIRFPRIP